ncbi:MAG TPA: AbrB family transcriptional regulator, partial [Limnochordales bacterium]
MGLHPPGPPAPHREGSEAGAARPVKAPGAGRAFVTAAAALGGGWLLSRLHLPVAWMLGPMLAAAGLNLAGWLHPVPPVLWRAAQAVIGASVASNLTPEVWARLAGAWPALVGAAAAGVAVGGLLGLALPRLVPVDRATALLGLVPGAASGMVAVSPDFGADPALVALVQYLR